MGRERAQISGLAPRKSHPETLQAVGNPYRIHRAYNAYHQNLDRYRTGGVATESNQTRHPAVDTVEVPTPKTTDQGMADSAFPGTFSNQDEKESRETSREGRAPTVDGIDVQSGDVSHRL